MAFITRALKRLWPDPSRPHGWVYLLAIAILCAPTAHASDFFITGVHTEEMEGVYLLDADIDYRFSDEALRALSNGVPLTLQLNIEIQRQRRWWLNEEVATLEQRYSLQYHALTHQYLLRNLNSGAFYSYPHYQSAVQALGTLRGFPLLDSKLVEADEQYKLMLQAELDIEALPSPLRPVAYLTPAWHLESDWYTWSITP